MSNSSEIYAKRSGITVLGRVSIHSWIERVHNNFTFSSLTKCVSELKQWSQRESNSQPIDPESDALPCQSNQQNIHKQINQDRETDSSEYSIVSDGAIATVCMLYAFITNFLPPANIPAPIIEDE